MWQRTVVRGLVLGIGLAVSSLSPAPPDEPQEKQELRKLQETQNMARILVPGASSTAPGRPLDVLARERRELAREGIRVSEQFVVAPPPAGRKERTIMEDIDRLHLWSQRFMEAEVDLGKTKADRIAAIRVHRERMRRLEDVINELRKGEASGVTRMDVLRITFHRLEAETLLAKEEAKPK